MLKPIAGTSQSRAIFVSQLAPLAIHQLIALGVGDPASCLVDLPVQLEHRVEPRRRLLGQPRDHLALIEALVFVAPRRIGAGPQLVVLSRAADQRVELPRYQLDKQT